MASTQSTNCNNNCKLNPFRPKETIYKFALPEWAHSIICVLLVVASTTFVLPAAAIPLGDSFTYQGYLNDLGIPADGVYDLEFTLTDDKQAGNVLDTIEVLGVLVSEGIFTVELDFGMIPFQGEERWLEIGVKGPGELAYTLLSPRQRIFPAPYSLYAKSVGIDTVGAAQAVASEVQLRVVQSCFGGSAISSIGEDGTVTCDVDDTATWVVVDPQTIYTPADLVGINESAPLATLHVNDAGTTKPAFYVENASGTEGDITWPNDETLHIGTWEPERLGFQRKMQIDSGGTVFIDNDLAFAGVLGDKISLFGDRIGQADSYGFGVAASTLYYKANGAHSWLIEQNSGAPPEMHLTATGLGIGTSAPNHELVVQGDDPSFQIRDDTTDNSENAARIELLERAGLNFDGGAFLWWNGDLNRLYIGTKNGGVNTNQLVIDRSSNSVGIGTQNIDTNHRLSVNGSIRAKEIIVETGWSDFVFEDNYRLRPLEEVETYIDVHGHLPDVPSEAEISREGVPLGTMAATLLQKVEELTLYTLQLHARIAELEARLEGSGS